MCVYSDSEHESWFREAWTKTGKKLNMGKSCVRFKKLDDVALKVIGQAIKRVPVKKFIENYESIVKPTGKRANNSGPAKGTRAKSTKISAKTGSAKTRNARTAKNSARKSTTAKSITKTTRASASKRGKKSR